MEWDNFQRGIHSKNHPGKLFPLAQEIKDSQLDFNDKKIVLDFIKNKTALLNLNPTEKISKIKKNWEKVEAESIKRMDVIFETSLKHDIMVYLTISSRCGYNIDQHYFFVNMFSKNTNLIILHELLHFYTYQTILPMFKKQKLNYDEFNDYKEALTFLLNTNFNDLLDGNLDNGYEKQKDLRIYLEKNWSKFNNVIDFSKFVTENYY
jgi:hypothetical protein